MYVCIYYPHRGSRKKKKRIFVRELEGGGDWCIWAQAVVSGEIVLYCIVLYLSYQQAYIYVYGKFSHLTGVGWGGGHLSFLVGYLFRV